MVSPSRQAALKHSSVLGPQTHRQEPSTPGVGAEQSGTPAQEAWKVDECALWAQTAQAQSAPRPTTKLATLSNSPTLDEPQFSPLENGIIH